MALSHALDARTAHRTVHRARAAIEHPVVTGLMRFGLIVRGIVYLLPGVLALRLALGMHGAAITQSDAIRMIGHRAFGTPLLLAIAVGLAGYVLWGIVRVLFDPLQRGRPRVGWVKRAGYVTSALAYTGLFILALQLLSGAATRGPQPHALAHDVLARPFGAWMLGLVGVCWIVGCGLTEIVKGWSGGFENDLDLARIGAIERRWASGLGRIGIVARGVVFAVIGVLLVTAAFHADSRDAGGMDGALLALQHQPFGRALLTAAALGLLAFGVYSMLCSRWMRMPARRTSTHPAP